MASPVISINNVAGLSLSAGVITVELGAPVSPAAQVGQRCKLTGTVPVPAIFNFWHVNQFYPQGKWVQDHDNEYWAATNPGTSGSTDPLTGSWVPGAEVVDNQGTGYSSPPITWIAIASNISWSFDVYGHIQSVPDSTHITLLADSEYQYYLGGLGGATGSAGGIATILNSTDKIMEIGAVAPYNQDPTVAGLQYASTVAYQMGAFIVRLASPSAILTQLWNLQNNDLQLYNNAISKQYVRLMDTQSALGTRFNGVYPISGVLSPSSFSVRPRGVQYLPNDAGGGGSVYFLATLSMSVPPAFIDMNPSMTANGQPASDDLLKGLKYAIAAACVRTEAFDSGYWVSGAVPSRISPVDKYPYALSEIGYLEEVAQSNPATTNNLDLGGGPVVGGALLPPQTAPWGYGVPIHAPYEVFVDQQGNVTLEYYVTHAGGGTSAEGPVNTGAMRVISICTRGSEAIQLPVNILALPPQL